jgi:hypothetical protein
LLLLGTIDSSSFAKNNNNNNKQQVTTVEVDKVGEDEEAAAR